MLELKITKSYVKYTHKEGSRYRLEDIDDDGIHISYTEIDKAGFGHYHKVHKGDRKEWDELCKLYPLG